MIEQQHIRTVLGLTTMVMSRCYKLLSGYSSQTSSYNLHTGILRAQGDGRFSQYNYGYEGDNNNTGIGYNVTGGWAMNVGRNDSDCATNQRSSRLHHWWW